jgi:hypothetical protein
MMTTEEKRNAIDAECNKHEGCGKCPGKELIFCKEFTTHTADPGVIDKWYKAFFMEDSVPHIKDSGTRREFETGAVRDIQEGKGRCDLLPLDVVARFRGQILTDISNYQESGDIKHLESALQRFIDKHCDKEVSTTFLEVSKHFEAGAKKYGEYNWQKGIPTRCYIDSAVRHYLKFLRGDKDEPHDRAFVWNILCCIWTCIHKPELNDYAKKDGTDNAEKT